MKHYIVISLFILLFSGCDKNGSTETPTLYNEALVLSASRTGANEWQSGDNIGLSMFWSGTEMVVDSNLNCEYVNLSGDNGDFKAASSNEIIRYPLNGKVDIVGYYPYNKSTGITTKLDCSDQSNQNLLDVLYSNNIKLVSNTTQERLFTFKHRLCRLQFTIVPGQGFMNEDFNNLKINLKGVAIKGTFNIVTGVITDTIRRDVSVQINDAMTCEAILLPQFFANANLEIVCGDLGYEVPLYNGGNSVWQEGNSYAYTIVMSKTPILITASVKEWVSNSFNTDSSLES